jgi:hypothetical protein
MPNYMLLLYADEDETKQEERWGEIALWDRVNAQLREEGVLIANGPLQPTATATSVRVRNEQTEITDGPFAVTKEVLAGYYLVECPDLDAALEVAERLPLARYGTVEVRPVLEDVPRG